MSEEAYSLYKFTACDKIPFTSLSSHILLGMDTSAHPSFVVHPNNYIRGCTSLDSLEAKKRMK